MSIMCEETEKGHEYHCVMYESGWLRGDEQRKRQRGKKRLCCPMMKGLID